MIYIHLLFTRTMSPQGLPGLMHLATTVSVIVLLICMAAVPVTSALEGDGIVEYFPFEEQPARTVIGNLASDAKLTEKYEASVLHKLRYSFLSQDGEEQRHFSLEENTGVIKTKDKIDRDEICPQLVSCFIWLDVAVQPPQYFQVIKIKVDILDQNDHNPVFPQKSIVLTIPESALVGSVYSLPTANDPDSPTYGIQKYELTTQTNKFELKSTRNKIDGSTDLKLILKKHLDRERSDSHQLRVIARDGGKPSLTGSLIVNIRVEDMNDNDPIFRNETYEIFALENTRPGSTITRVRATDADLGLNGEITYGFSDSTYANYGDTFGIDNSTGRIYLKRSLDYEKKSTYLMAVIARDKGPGSRVGRANVAVRVRDDNDNVPIITVNSLTQSGIAQASESAPPETFVAFVSVSDADSEQNGLVSCFVSHSRDHFKLFQLYKTQYKLITDSHLDREAHDRYQVTITCHDHGNPQNTATRNVTVLIIDENDHVPVFDKKIYRSEILENNYIGAAITKLNATDLDTGNNGQVRFKVEQDWEGRIQVQPITGEVSAGAVFDREEVKEISFLVIAYDLGDPSLSSTASVIVGIQDVNDEKPEFSRHGYTFGVFENEAPGTLVGEVTAIDRDSGINSQFEYTILDADTDATRWFAIDPVTGIITTKVVFDWEEETAYSFTVRAANPGYPVMSSTASVTIYIADRNDNAPIVDFPNATNNTIFVSNMVPVGHIITRIIAHDADGADNKKLIHYLTGGNTDNIFQLDAQTGELAVGTSMMSITYETYHLTILIKDSGHPPQRANAELRVVVNHSIAYNLNDESPDLSRDRLTIIVAISLASLIVLLVICLAICVIIRKSRHARKHSGKYSCRNETERMLSMIDEKEKEKQKQYTERDTLPVRGSCPHIDEEKQLEIEERYTTGTLKKHIEADEDKIDTRFIISVSPTKGYLKDKSPVHQKPDLTRSHVMYMRADGDRSSTGSEHTSSADSGRGHSDSEIPSRGLSTFQSPPVESPEADFRISDEEDVYIPLTHALNHQRH